jgi:hypothetical protein
MKALLQSLIILFFFSYKMYGQNYLYKKNDGGMSGYIGVISEDLKNRDAYGFGVDYTAKGFFSVGISRIVLNNGYNSNNGVTSINASITPIKTEKGNLTFSIPLFIGTTLSKDNSILTFGGSLAFRNQINEKTSVIPVLSLGFNSVKNFRNQSSADGNIGFELNILVNKFRINPSISFSENASFFGIAGGFVL